MKIQFQTTNHMEYIFNWDKTMKDFLDEVLFCDPKRSLLTECCNYVMVGHIVSFREIKESNENK